MNADWASFFEGFELGFARYQKRGEQKSSPIDNSRLEGLLKTNKIEAVPGTRSADPQCIEDTRGREHRSDAAMRDFSIYQDTLLDVRVENLVNAYRTLGHTMA